MGEEWLFVYGIRHNGEGEYSRFDRCSFPKTTDAQKEWDWADFQAVAECSGLLSGDLRAFPFPCLVRELVNFYGCENVFGTSYWEGFAIAD